MSCATLTAAGLPSVHRSFEPAGGISQLHSILPRRLTAQGRCAPFPSLRSVRGSPFRGMVVPQAKHRPTGQTEGTEMNNKVKLVGRLTKDAELTERNEKKVCDMRLAVNGRGETPDHLHRHRRLRREGRVERRAEEGRPGRGQGLVALLGVESPTARSAPSTR